MLYVQTHVKRLEEVLSADIVIIMNINIIFIYIAFTLHIRTALIQCTVLTVH